MVDELAIGELEVAPNRQESPAATSEWLVAQKPDCGPRGKIEAS